MLDRGAGRNSSLFTYFRACMFVLYVNFRSFRLLNFFDEGVIVSNLLFLLSNLLFFPEAFFPCACLNPISTCGRQVKKKPCETQDAVPGALLNLSEVAPGECYPERFL